MTNEIVISDNSPAANLRLLADELLASMTPVAGTIDALRHHRHHFDEEAIAISLRVAARRSALVVEALRLLTVSGAEAALGFVAEHGAMALNVTRPGAASQRR